MNYSPTLLFPFLQTLTPDPDYPMQSSPYAASDQLNSSLGMGQSWEAVPSRFHKVYDVQPSFYPTPELYFPPSPSDRSSSSLSEFSQISYPQYVVCNAPLVAPIPLPYHSPTFLQFELPDSDQDLSHPPYTSRQSSKRKRDPEEQCEGVSTQSKRRTLVLPLGAGRIAKKPFIAAPNTRRLDHHRTSP
ncbi:hypothetical protein BDQ12DRAFT_719584 [Crucibulum laeve]|uniref:Uncharacterized protein n=1 Tax=Crucibulum laeve TaxID=68775 RepID=A0A5C3MBD9_9AGAR|nr:hypothetical protein BDQ12DRAFT_719584 [Crucibulum laeve]